MSLPEHRAGDADRDRVAAVLREAHAEGRLDLDELSERLEAAYRAKTYGELEVLTGDLPSIPRRANAAPSPQAQPPARRDDKSLRALWATWAMAVSVNVVIWLLVSISNGDAAYFWPMWVAGPWGAGLVVLTVSRRLGR